MRWIQQDVFFSLDEMRSDEGREGEIDRKIDRYIYIYIERERTKKRKRGWTRLCRVQISCVRTKVRVKSRLFLHAASFLEEEEEVISAYEAHVLVEL